MAETFVVHPFAGTLAEAEAIRAIDRQVWNQCPYSAEQLVPLFTRPEHQVWIAWVDEQPAGFLSGFRWCLHQEQVWEIDVVVTAPAFRRWGIATALIETAYQAVQATPGSAPKVDWVRGIVATRNSPSVQAFTKAGFTPDPIQALLVYDIQGRVPRPALAAFGGQPVQVEWTQPDPPVFAPNAPAFQGQWLLVHQGAAGNSLLARAWCVRVDTFLYSGFWLEQIECVSHEWPALGVLAHAAVERAKVEGLDTVGALVPEAGHRRTILAGEGFRLQDHYRIFRRT